jgi:GT2 family glycosyltransferase
VSTDLDRGPSYERNIGAKLAKSPIVLFADDDVIVVDDIEILLQYLESGICEGIQPLILRFSDQEIVDSAGDFARKNKWNLLDPYCRGAGMRIDDLRRDLYIEEIPSMKGAFMAVAKEALFSIGSFDGTFDFGYEDVDLGWRMTIAGYRLLFMPTVTVLHKGGRSMHPTEKDEKVFRLDLLNYHAMQLKTTKCMWPLLFVRFYGRLLGYEIVKAKKGKVNFINALRDFLNISKLFTQRANSARKHKIILTKKYDFRGKKKLEEMAKGKRFIYNQSL